MEENWLYLYNKSVLNFIPTHKKSINSFDDLSSNPDLSVQSPFVEDYFPVPLCEHSDNYNNNNNNNNNNEVCFLFF